VRGDAVAADALEHVAADDQALAVGHRTVGVGRIHARGSEAIHERCQKRGLQPSGPGPRRNDARCERDHVEPEPTRGRHGATDHAGARGGVSVDDEHPFPAGNRASGRDRPRASYEPAWLRRLVESAHARVA
jgi:hypothetical protein